MKFIKFILILLLILIYKIISNLIKDAKQRKEYKKHKAEYEADFEPIIRKKDLTEYNPNYLPYAKGHLLTKTEHTFFITLVREALKRRLLVCPKVRLEDIIYVTDKQNRNKYRGYIKSRHVDFVLLNANCETVAAIELDDPSHTTKKATKADQFKNDLFFTVKIPLIRIYAGTDYIKEINYAFDELKFPKAELQKPTNPSQNS
ncbi:MAG: DUF2726 domain-containing protein [Lachnospiraceae bacterium]|nr:DUF2726 domain-containing protein [Lachnospiraceae bacterium]